MENNVYGFKLEDINGTPSSLAQYKGKALLIVNVASQCGLTPQYEGLEALYEKYQKQGLEILGFPANEFAAQEPGTNAEIKDFCVMKFGIKFPLFAKIVVKGENQHPLYKFLTSAQKQATTSPGSNFEQVLEGYGEKRTNPLDVLWNFEKFLIARDGVVIGRFAPDMEPNDELLVSAIESALG